LQWIAPIAAALDHRDDRSLSSSAASALRQGDVRHARRRCCARARVALLQPLPLLLPPPAELERGLVRRLRHGSGHRHSMAAAR
jgi:hypothetical protein